MSGRGGGGVGSTAYFGKEYSGPNMTFIFLNKINEFLLKIWVGQLIRG
jgi:hypothetical protein